MSPDDRARLFDELPVVSRLLEQLSPAERQTTAQLLVMKRVRLGES